MSEIRIIAWVGPEYPAAVAVRRAVLRAPLDLDFTPEQLAAEAADTHICAFTDGELTGTVILSPYDGQTVKLRQMATADNRRGQGLGSALLTAAEAEARRQGKYRIVLAARLDAQGFYQRHGYAAQGGIFTEVTLPHILMSRAI
ncbi:GNAT family N-acetyltransferase [Asticcacaulis sp. EMRT-3]|uniref:GNAT family N-acetyltransferase n=1 Tax=Asticcacaulis sp. EMRT-3 TaxID=3040349 RepID=UPI0024AF6F0C|nr:GNAT family N-acetyltransferase [Asticcacaulis sp. EMRT-3]MDI7774045.1 GNAT family N-acetyltransferase [Asticcacaulis sp. EMRT-3]